MKKTDELIIVEEIYNAPIGDLWNALTDINLMRQWYFNNIPDFKPVAGFETEFLVKSEERNFKHHWKVLEAEKNKIIKYSWDFEGYKGKSTSSFEISRTDQGTKLKIVVEVLEDYPDDIPEFKRESCIAGWEYLLKEKLKDYFQKK